MPKYYKIFVIIIINIINIGCKEIKDYLNINNFYYKIKEFTAVT